MWATGQAPVAGWAVAAWCARAPPVPPRRFSVSAGEYRYFKSVVPHGEGLNIAVTPLSGDPDLFVSTTVAKPDSMSPECTASAGHSSWCSGNAPGRYEHVEIAADDTSICQNVAECQFNIAVLAKTSSTFTITATWGATPIRLVDGVPQAGQIASAGLSRSYKTRVAGTHTDLSITLTNAWGNAHIYVQAGSEATAAHHTWTSDTQATTATTARRAASPSTVVCFAHLSPRVRAVDGR